MDGVCLVDPQLSVPRSPGSSVAMESSRLHSTLARLFPLPSSFFCRTLFRLEVWSEKIVYPFGSLHGPRGGGGVGRPGRGQDRRHRLVPARVPRGGHGLSRASEASEAALGGGADAEPAEEAAPSAVRQGAIHK